jgi:hypothetical protein
VRPASPDLLGGPAAKRLRVGYDHYPPPTSGQRSPLVPTPDASRYPMSWQAPELPRIHEDVLQRAWQTDPYVSDLPSMNTTIASSFVHLDSTALRFLPERAFVAWLQSSASAHQRKSPEDLMLVYSVLALGAALSDVPKKTVDEYVQVARFAAEHGRLSIQLVQSRLLLSLYYMTASRASDAVAMISCAMSAATSLHLHVEMEHSPDAGMATFPYDLSRRAFAECRRRTFWACFVLERMTGSFPAKPVSVQADDVYLRLPQDTASFEGQVEVKTPFFEPHFSTRYNQYETGMGIAGYFVQILAIWSEAMAVISRVSVRGSNYNGDIDRFHQDTTARLEDWAGLLPARLTGIVANYGSLAEWEKSTFIAMHSLYYTTIIKTNRHLTSRTLGGPQHQLTAAQDQASRLLGFWNGIVQAVAPERVEELPRHPLASSALLEAVDVLSAGGHCSQLPALVGDVMVARLAMEALLPVWAEARQHCIALECRLDLLTRVRDLGPAANNPAHGVRVFTPPGATQDAAGQHLPAALRWQVSDPIEARFPRELDCVYNALADEATV